MRLFLTIFGLVVVAQGWSQPTGTTDYFAEGKKAKADKNYTLAIENFKKATDQKPSYGEAWFELGWCYNEQEKYEDAVKALKNAKTWWNDKPKVFYESGYANDFAGKTEDAVQDYKKCIELDESYSDAYRQLANIYFDVDKDYETALEYYSKFVDNSVETDITAKTWYKKGAEINPKSHNCNFGTGWCYNEKSNYESAIPYLKKAIELDDTYASGYTELGYSYYALKKYDEALVELENSVKIAENSVPYYYMGLCYVSKNQKTKAQEIYKKLTDLNSPDAAKLLVKINAM
jgi:tetratricopeptide (TPR) repeat protein